MKNTKLILVFFPFLFSFQTLKAQDAVINRELQMINPELWLNQNLSIFDVNLYRSKVGKRLLAYRNMLPFQSIDYQGRSFNQSVKQMRFTNEGRSSRSLSLSSNGPDFQQLTFYGRSRDSYYYDGDNKDDQMIATFRSYKDHRSSDNNSQHALFGGNFAILDDFFISPLFSYRNEFYGDKQLKSSVKELYRNKGSKDSTAMYSSNSIFASINMTATLTNQPYYSNELSVGNLNTIALNKYLFNGDRRVVQEQITNISSVRLSPDLFFHKLMFGLDHMYRKTNENINDTVYTLQHLGDWALFGDLKLKMSERKFFTLRWRTHFSNLNGWVHLPAIAYESGYARKLFMFKYSRIYNDDISVFENVLPYMYGNRKLSVLNNRNPELRESFELRFDRIREAWFFQVLATQNYHQNYYLYDFEPEANRIGQRSYQGWESRMEAKIGLVIYNKANRKLSFNNSYYLKHLYGDPYGVNIAGNTLSNGLSFIHYSSRNTQEISIVHYSRWGFDNPVPYGEWSRSQTGILDFKASFRFKRRYTVGLNVYDILSRQVRVNMDEQVKGFKGTQVMMPYQRFSVKFGYNL